MKKERFGKTFICNSVALFVYTQYNHIFFTLKQIDLSKSIDLSRLIYWETKGNKNFRMWMLELFMNVDKLVGIKD